MDHCGFLREDEKLNRYGPLAGEVGRIHKVRTEIIPIVIGALGTVPKRLPKFIARLGIPDVIRCLQTAALLGTQRILRNTLSISVSVMFCNWGWVLEAVIVIRSHQHSSTDEYKPKTLNKGARAPTIPNKNE